MSALSSEADSLVRSRFQVKDTFNLPDGEVEYRISYDPQTKPKFVELVGELKPRGLVAWLSGTEEDCALQLRKEHPPKPSASRVPVILALSAVAMILVFGLFEIWIFGEFAPSVPDYIVFVSYAACMVAILAAHEFGHRYQAEKSASSPPISYFIPGIPLVTFFLSSLGIVSRYRSAVLNRDAVFDIALAGPVVAFIVTVLLYAISEFASVQSAIPLVAGQLRNAQFQVQVYNPSAIQMAVDAAFSFVSPIPTGGYVKLSPISDAASVGFVLTFLSLLPIALFDGGQLASTVLGSGSSKVVSYLSGIALLAIDFPTYWFVGFLVILIGWRQADVPLKDQVSKLSASRRAIFFLMLVLAFLCMPVPQNIASIPLR